jgi:hypothetical protein
MTGMPDLNYPAFFNAEDRLNMRGESTQNPAENKVGPEGTWRDYMRLGIGQLVQCKGIYLLKGWEKSEGAVLELYLARRLGMEVKFEVEDNG